MPHSHGLFRVLPITELIAQHPDSQYTTGTIDGNALHSRLSVVIWAAACEPSWWLKSAKSGRWKQKATKHLGATHFSWSCGVCSEAHKTSWQTLWVWAMCKPSLRALPSQTTASWALSRLSDFTRYGSYWKELGGATGRARVKKRFRIK